MPVNRDEALRMLRDYLQRKISKETIQQWAFNIVISNEFDKLHIKDKLLSETIHALFDLHHEGKDQRFDPKIEELEYYKNCLEGKVAFESRGRR